MNKFRYSNDNKRYHTFNYYLKNKYQNKVAKVALNANFTCPNRDGSKGIGGCIFCSNSGSGDYAGNVEDTLLQQFHDQSLLMQKKWPGCLYIAYLQANSNTYGPIKKIKDSIEPFIGKKDVVGIAVATRPDCLNEEIVQYLASVNERTDLWVELGLQTIHDETAKIINRGHTYQEFLDGLALLNQYHIPCCVHIINGLPHESIDMMLQTAKELGQLNIQAIKIHMLYVIKNTKLAYLYNQEDFTMLDREQYIHLVCHQLEYIPEDVVIERLTGDGVDHDLIAPLWSKKKVTILNDIDKYMKDNDLYQGDKLKR